MNNVLLWTTTHRRARVGQPVRIYIHQFCADTGYHLEDLPNVMNDRGGWRESQVTPCYSHKLMMMMITVNNLRSVYQTKQNLIINAIDEDG